MNNSTENNVTQLVEALLLIKENDYKEFQKQGPKLLKLLDISKPNDNNDDILIQGNAINLISSYLSRSLNDDCYKKHQLNYQQEYRNLNLEILIEIICDLLPNTQDNDIRKIILEFNYDEYTKFQDNHQDAILDINETIKNLGYKIEIKVTQIDKDNIDNEEILNTIHELSLNDTNIDFQDENALNLFIGYIKDKGFINSLIETKADGKKYMKSNILLNNNVGYAQKAFIENFPELNLNSDYNIEQENNIVKTNNLSKTIVPNQQNNTIAVQSTGKSLNISPRLHM